MKSNPLLMALPLLVVLAVINSGLAGEAPSATQPTEFYHLKAGPYPTGSVNLVLHDAARNKDLPIKVRFPTQCPTSRPVILFSHGAGGSYEGFAALTDHWASYGYVVLLPTHSDSIALRWKMARIHRR